MNLIVFSYMHASRCIDHLNLLSPLAPFSNTIGGVTMVLPGVMFTSKLDRELKVCSFDGFSLMLFQVISHSRSCELLFTHAHVSNFSFSRLYKHSPMLLEVAPHMGSYKKSLCHIHKSIPNKITELEKNHFLELPSGPSLG